MQVALAGIGGVVGGGLLPGGVEPIHAQVAPGGSVTPAVGRIAKSDLPPVALVDFSTPPRTSSVRPYADLNYLLHRGDGTARMFACDTRGKLYSINTGTGSVTLALDLKKARGASFPTPSQQMGLRSVAVHPDFARSGRPGYRRLYTAHTETAASRSASVPLFAVASTTPVDHHNVITEWRVYVSNRDRVDPSSRREVLRIAQHRSDHSTDTILFNPIATAGQADYGKLYIGTGDGGNTPDHPDMYNHAQDPGRALGKILRIDPLAQSGGRRYGVPADNPRFVDRPGWLPELWAIGFRHPQNLAFDRATGVLYNVIVRSGNYGWPLREGTFVTDRNDQTKLYALPANDAANGFIYPVAQYDHGEGVGNDGKLIAKGKLAITGGFVYRGTALPALNGHYVFGDLVNGRIFHVPVSELRLGSQATIKELSLSRNGVAVTLQQLVGTTDRVDMRFGMSESGSIYVMTKQDGKIRRLAPS